MKLNLGCGNVHMDGYVNVDNEPSAAADKVVDLNVFPWPFPDNSADEVYCSHVLEHVDDVLKAITEIHRVLKPDGVLRVIAPYYASPGAFYDLTHKHFFGYKSFDQFFDNRPYGYVPGVRFKLLSRRLVFAKAHQLLGISFLANRFPRIYEDFLAGIAPAREVRFELACVKAPGA